jgi:hydroxymethylglutaryl-CoA reductase (NADPH)
MIKTQNSKLAPPAMPLAMHGKTQNQNSKIQKGNGLNLRELTNVEERRAVLEKNLGIELSNIGYFSLNEDKASSRNCENMIGVAQIPMGVAGPLLINFSGKIKEYFVPLVTTEGALVASVNRGCKAIFKSKGVTVLVENVGITRAPVLRTTGITQSKNLYDWILTHKIQLAEIMERTSRHLKLLEVSCFMAGRNVYARFSFSTGEAMGMNMVTIAVDKALSFIERETKAKAISLSGNMCTDKKPSSCNYIFGRGKKVWAEVKLSREVCQQILKSTPEEICEVNLRKDLIGGAMAGGFAFNAHYANIVAALFTATGQDLAHVAEGALGITTAETVGGNLLFDVYLPDLPCGVIGGGTGLETQKEAISILKLDNGDDGQKTMEFAGVIGGAVLAGELSLHSALAAGELSLAHRRLARRENV